MDSTMLTLLHLNGHKMGKNQPTDKFQTNLESWEPGLEDRLWEKLSGATIKA